MNTILIVSRFWQEYDNSGMGFCSSMHYEILLDAGYNVKRIGTTDVSSDNSIDDYFYVRAEGAGSIYSKVSLDREELLDLLKTIKPNLILIEGWQTGIGEETVDLAYQLQIPVVIISHGLSLLPYDLSFSSIIRSLLWAPFALVTFPKTLRKLTAITTLHRFASSTRFSDRKCAELFNKEVFLLSNQPVNHGRVQGYFGRKKQILCLGYFSEVKNQLKALKILQLLPTDIEMVFVGNKEGAYYKKMTIFIERNSLCDRVKIYEDKEVNISELYEQVLVVLSSSITEALPLVLLEAMATGTPFVATDVGANSQLRGGFVSNSNKEICKFISELAKSENLWNRYSENGIEDVRMNYSSDLIREQMSTLVTSILTTD